MAIITPLKKLFAWQYAHDKIDQLKVKILGYRSYKALLVQTGTNDPVATVLENTLGINVTYQYDTDGTYFAFINSDLFANPYETVLGEAAEVTITPSYTIDPFSGDPLTMTAYPVFFFVLSITSAVSGTLADDVLGSYFSTVIEIKVYNK